MVICGLGFGGLDARGQSLSTIDYIYQDGINSYVFWTAWPGKYVELQIGLYDGGGNLFWHPVYQLSVINPFPESLRYTYPLNIQPMAMFRIEEF